MQSFKFITTFFLTLGFTALAAAGVVTPTPSPAFTPKNNIDQSVYSYFSQNQEAGQTSNSDLLMNLGVDISTTGKMKDHFRKGMKLFLKDKWEAATPELVASTMIVDPYTWNYWYAEAYATLGVIYEFHSKEPNHKDMAYLFYKLALKHDPKTFSAKFYLNSVSPTTVKKNSSKKG